MAKFFVNRPIVAMVISIIMILVGVVALKRLPVAQYPEITPPEIMLAGHLHRRQRGERGADHGDTDRAATQWS